MTPTPQAPTDRAELLAAIIAAELLVPSQFARAAATLPDHAATAEQAARYLIATGTLTRFQADRLLAGRTDGFVLDAHVIQEPVGKGAAGRVFKATHRTMNRTVAIKVLNPDATRTEAARQAVRREVRAAARLNHPNVVTAYDAGEVGDRSYLVMEYVDGPTLDALVRDRGPLPVGEACELVRQVAVGLQHAHEQGMVHRDVKPQNLLVGRASKTLPGCVVKIADFGIARLGPPPAAPAGRPAGVPGLIGTPDYVAPEQAATPHAADHRADLYSLGCVFYFLLTGRPPFAGGTAADKVRRHQFDAPTPVERLRPDVPAEVAEIVARLMAKDPNARFQGAAGLAARLDRLAAAAVVVDEEGGLVNFELPAARAGQFPYASGYLTGLHPIPAGSGLHPTLSGGGSGDPAAETSPWAQLTDEVSGAVVSPPLDMTPAPPKSRRLAVPPAPPAGGSGVAATALALCGTVLVSFLLGSGLLLRVAAR